MDINVHIETLALEGFDPQDRYRLAEALEVELARRFTGGGVPPEWRMSRSIGFIDGGSFMHTPGLPVQAAGSAIARAIYRAAQSTPARLRATSAPPGAPGATSR